MEIFSFPNFPLSSSLAYITLYTNVTNTSALRKRITDAATALGTSGDEEREAVNFSFINARLIVSRLHLQTAIYQAILAQSQNSLRTRTVHSEVLWALNPTNNINEAFRRYGISEASTDILVIRISGPGLSEERVREMMSGAVNGTVISFAMVDKLTDWMLIRKYHKLDNDPGILQDGEVVQNLVVSTVAVKSVIV